jgi:hypothetical protein
MLRTEGVKIFIREQAPVSGLPGSNVHAGDRERIFGFGATEEHRWIMALPTA